MSKRFLSLLLIALMTVQSFAAEVSPKREVRSVWVATVWGLDWPSTTGTSATTINAQKNSLISMIENLEENNFNAIYFQVRSMCDAMYKSSYEPWSSYLTGSRGTDPGWDPLAFAVEECHKRGIECHAWINPYRWSTGTAWNTSQDQALKNNNMLLAYTTTNNSKPVTTTILDPARQETRERIVNVCRELASNYNIDGIVFDDYFYPNGIPTNSSAGDYSEWVSSGNGASFADWRRANINLMIKNVYDMIQDVKPWLKFGISPAGVAGASASKYGVTPCPKGSDWQYDKIYSDPLAWLSEGTIDYISPQIYWGTTHSTNPFGPITDWWSYVAKHFGRHHYASHSISSNNGSATYCAEVAKQVECSREYTENAAPGAVFYSTKYITGAASSSGGALGAYIKENKFQNHALTPAVTWKESEDFQAVTNFKKSGTTLTWDAATGKGIIKYSVYAIPTSIMPNEAAGNHSTGFESTYLLGVTYDNNFTLDTSLSTDYWYAVCVVDGYGNEFEASTILIDDIKFETSSSSSSDPIASDITVDSNMAITGAYFANGTTLTVKDGAKLTLDKDGTYDIKNILLEDGAEINADGVENLTATSLEVIKEFTYKGTESNKEWFNIGLPFEVTAGTGSVKYWNGTEYVIAVQGKNYATYDYNSDRRAKNGADGENWDMYLADENYIGEIIQFENAGVNKYKFTATGNDATVALTDGREGDRYFQANAESGSENAGWNIIPAGKTFTTDYNITDVEIAQEFITNGSFRTGSLQNLTPGTVVGIKLNPDVSQSAHESNNSTETVERYIFELIDATGSVLDRIYLFDGSNKQQYRVAKMAAFTATPQISITKSDASYCAYSTLASDSDKSYDVSLTNLSEGCKLVMSNAGSQSVSIDGSSIILGSAISVEDGSINIKIGSTISSVANIEIIANVYTSNNSIIIDTTETTSYSIANMSGVTVTSGIANGETAIKMTPGIYIVNIAEEYTKVIIK